MPVDFDRHLMAPAMRAFGRTVEIIPQVSQPGEPSYEATGIFDRRYASVETMDGIHSALQAVLSVRSSDYAVRPTHGDRVFIGQDDYLVHDVEPDAEGSTILVLKGPL